MGFHKFSLWHFEVKKILRQLISYFLDLFGKISVSAWSYLNLFKLTLLLC